MNLESPPSSLVFHAPLQRVRRGLRIAFRRTVQPVVNTELPGLRPASLARCLALAHRLQRALDHGEVATFDALAQRLGVSKARLSVLLALLSLAPDIQEEILYLDVGNHLGLPRVLAIARELVWGEQRRLWQLNRNGNLQPRRDQG